MRTSYISHTSLLRQTCARGVLILLVAMVAWAGQPAKEKTQVFTGTAPIGQYTSGIFSPGAGKTRLGVEIDQAQLTDPATAFELVGELSYDGGQTWPPACLPPPALWCHEATQPLPANTDWFWVRSRGDPSLAGSSKPTSGEFSLGRVTDAQTRFRGRLTVRGADATGTVWLTWR
jgi:hypothetical protein